MTAEREQEIRKQLKIIRRKYLITAPSFDAMCEEILALGVRQQRWIPVEEKLPEIDKEVLCAFLSYNDKFHVLDVAHLGEGAAPGERLWFYSDNYFDFNRVTHWQPLPEPTCCLRRARLVNKFWR